MQVDAATLSQMTEAIVRTVAPEKVILFGSQARGDSGADSDVDFMVIVPGEISPQRSRRKLAGDLYRVLAPFRIPKDILLYTSSEVDRWRNSTNHMIGRSFREGKVLYERH